MEYVAVAPHAIFLTYPYIIDRDKSNIWFVFIHQLALKTRFEKILVYHNCVNQSDQSEHLVTASLSFVRWQFRVSAQPQKFKYLLKVEQIFDH